MNDWDATNGASETLAWGVNADTDPFGGDDDIFAVQQAHHPCCRRRRRK
jgi:hypothetical protein